MVSKTKVGIACAQAPWRYPVEQPFRPEEAYPELKGRVAVGREQNITYALFRRLLRDLGMDIGHFSTPDWNPFSEIIFPGQKVLIKPNLVRHLHLGGGDYNAVVTHGSLVRCVLDYVALALQGRGEIAVGDAPVQSADFALIVERMGLREICRDVAEIWQIPVRLSDFRLWCVHLDESHRVVSGGALEGDTAGYCRVDLGKRSLLSPLGSQSEKFRVTNYDPTEMGKHHNRSTNEYLIPRTVLDADVIISLPKLKTHRKVGLTAALKNVVGINGHKDWLPHHRVGSLDEGGDEYLRASVLKRMQTQLAERIDRAPHSPVNRLGRLMDRVLGGLARSIAPDPFFEGSWYGNDTLWRTALDLNRLLLYADRKGIMMDVPQRKCLTVVDAMVAGEGDGPMEPTPRSCGILAGGMNPVAVDAVLATMIGFDFRKIPLIANGFNVKDWPLVGFGPQKVRVCSRDSRWGSLRVGEARQGLCFTPPSGWLGNVELPSWRPAQKCL